MSNLSTGPTNPYAAPITPFQEVAVPQASGEVSRQTVELMHQTRPWVLFLGIVGIIGSVLMFGGAGVILIVTLAQGNPTLIAIGVAYAVMAMVYIVPSFSLIRFSQHITGLVEKPSIQNLETALHTQKRFWRFVGIVTAVVLVLYALMIVGAFVFGIARAAR